MTVDHVQDENHKNVAALDAVDGNSVGGYCRYARRENIGLFAVDNKSLLWHVIRP